MKKVKLFWKKSDKIVMDSLTMFRASLRANPDALRGLDNITMAISLNKKMMDLTPGKDDKYPEFVVLTSEEYEFLKRCVDTMQWGPAILDFEEFIQSMKFPEESKE